MTEHVAIVDDDESVRRAMARLMGAHSFAVRSYGSAREFLNSLEAGEPDCLILDLRMPGMTGLELLHHLAGRARKIPVIIMTADDQPGLRYRCELAGAFEFLTKPAPVATLLDTVRAATRAAIPAASN